MPSPNLSDLIANDQELQDLKKQLGDFFAGAGRGLTTDTIGAPVDLISTAMKAAKIPVGDAPVGGSSWLRKVLDQPAEEQGSSLVGNLLSSLVNPETAAKSIPLLLGAIRPFGAKNLAMVHNMSGGLNFLRSGKSLGNPSIAIAENPYPFDRSPTLVFNPDSKLFDPANMEQNQLFNRDAYTDRAKTLLHGWGQEFRLKGKDLRYTEGFNPSKEQKLAIDASPRFKSFKDYETKKSGAGTLGQPYYTESSDLYAEVQRYLRDNVDKDTSQAYRLAYHTPLDYESYKTQLDFLASRGNKAAQGFLKRASELGSDYAELKVIGQVPVDPYNVNALLLPRGELTKDQILEYMKEGKARGIPTGIPSMLASPELKDKAAEAAQRMLSEFNFYNKHMGGASAADIGDLSFTGFNNSTIPVSSMPGMTRKIIGTTASSPEVTKARFQNNIWESPELLQELLQELSASKWAKR